MTFFLPSNHDCSAIIITIYPPFSDWLLLYCIMFLCVYVYLCTHQEGISGIGRKGNLFYSYYLLHAIQTFDEKILSISVEQLELISSQFSYLILITFTHPSAFYLKRVTFIAQWTFHSGTKLLKIFFCIYLKVLGR